MPQRAVIVAAALFCLRGASKKVKRKKVAFKFIINSETLSELNDLDFTMHVNQCKVLDRHASKSLHLQKDNLP